MFLACLTVCLYTSQTVSHPSKRTLNGALIEAVAFGKERSVRKLLSKGADPNARDDMGQTALMDAAFEQDEGVAYCYPDIAAILVKHGATVNAKDRDGQTALMYLAQIGPDNEGDAVVLARYLIAHGARTNVRATDGKTAVRTAQENGMDRLVRLLKRTVRMK